VKFAIQVAACLAFIFCFMLPAEAQFQQAVWDTITADTLQDALTPQAIAVNGYEQFHLTYTKPRVTGGWAIYYRYFDLLAGMGPETAVDTLRACFNPVIASRYSDNDFNIDILYESGGDIWKCSSLSPFGPWGFEDLTGTAEDENSPSVAWGYNFLHGAWITYTNSEYEIVYMRTGGGEPRDIDVIEESDLGQFGSGAQPFIVAVGELPHIFYRGVSGSNYSIHHAYKTHADSGWTFEQIPTPNADDFSVTATYNGVGYIFLAISGNDGFGFPGRVYYTYRDPSSGEWSVPDLVTGPYSATKGSIIVRPGRVAYIASCGVTGNIYNGDIFISSNPTGSFNTHYLAVYQSCSQPVLADIIGEYAVLMFDSPIGADEQRNIEIVYYGPAITNAADDSPTPSILGFTRTYPNPFNTQVNVEFGLENSAHIRLDIFDILGRRIETLADRDFDSGEHSVRWDAANWPSGVYFYRIHAAGQSRTGKMALLK
jgi:hypothetical protein